MNQLSVPNTHVVPVDQHLETIIGDWKSQLSLQVSSGDISQNTANTYLKGWNLFWEWNAGSPVDETQILEWKRHLNGSYSSATVNTWLAGVKAFFGWAVRSRLLFVDPSINVKSNNRKGRYKHKRGIISNGDVRKVLDQPNRNTQVGKRDYAILCLKAYGALRDIEIHRAELSHLGEREGVQVLYIIGKGKIDADEFVVIAHPELKTALHEWLQVHPQGAKPLFPSFSKRSGNKPLSLSFIRRMVKGYINAAGVKGKPNQPITSHSFRHSAITNAIRHGCELPKVRNFARHGDINTTLGYYHEIERLENPAEGYIEYDSVGE